MTERYPLSPDDIEKESRKHVKLILEKIGDLHAGESSDCFNELVTGIRHLFIATDSVRMLTYRYASWIEFHENQELLHRLGNSYAVGGLRSLRLAIFEAIVVSITRLICTTGSKYNSLSLQKICNCLLKPKIKEKLICYHIKATSSFPARYGMVAPKNNQEKIILDNLTQNTISQQKVAIEQSFKKLTNLKKRLNHRDTKEALDRIDTARNKMIAHFDIEHDIILDPVQSSDIEILVKIIYEITELANFIGLNRASPRDVPTRAFLCAKSLSNSIQKPSPEQDMASLKEAQQLGISFIRDFCSVN